MPDVLERMAGRFDIVFLHLGSKRRRFIPPLSLGRGRKLGWVRFSQMGAQGVVIARQAARRFLDTEPGVRPGLGRRLARYWHHGLRTCCLRPAVVTHVENHGDYESLIGVSPAVKQPEPGRRVRAVWYDAREGAAKRLAFARLVIGAHGVVKGVQAVLGRELPLHSVRN